MSYSEQLLAALSDGDVEKATSLFAQVVAHDDDETQYNLAQELYALGFIDQAAKLYQRLLELYPDQDDIKAVLADIATSNGQPDQALAYIDQIGSNSDYYAEALMTAADVYQTQGLYEVSEQKLLEAKRLYPDEPVIDFALGELYLAWGKDQAAASTYAELLAQGETLFAGVNVTARYATALANLGQFEEAVAEYEEAGVDELDINSRFTLGSLYLQLKQPDRAATLLEAVVAQDQSFTNAYLPLAQAQVANHQQEAALTTVQTGLAQDDANDALYVTGADLAVRQGDLALAETYLKQAMSLDPENQSTMVAWSNLLLAKGEDEANVEFLEAMAKQGEGEPQIYWNLAKSYDRLDQVAKARENYLLAFSRFEHSKDFLLDLIDFFQSTAATAELKAAMQRYLALVPDDADMQARYDQLQGED